MKKLLLFVLALLILALPVLAQDGLIPVCTSSTGAPMILQIIPQQEGFIILYVSIDNYITARSYVPRGGILTPLPDVKLIASNCPTAQ